MTVHHAPAVTSPSKFAAFTLIAAVRAAAAAFTTLSLSLLPWAMFVGWVAWFTRPTDTRQAAYAVLCTWLGMTLAAIGEAVVGARAGSVQRDELSRVVNGTPTAEDPAQVASSLTVSPT